MFVLCFIVHLLGTYDVTEAILYNDLSNIGRICCSCHFIRAVIVMATSQYAKSQIYLVLIFMSTTE